MVNQFNRPEFNLWYADFDAETLFRFDEPDDDDDDDGEDDQPLHKRCKTSQTPPPAPPPLIVKESFGINEFDISPSKFDPLEEPSPLGLRLRKSPSLLELIQMRLSEGNTASVDASLSGDPKMLTEKELRVVTALSSQNSLKRDTEKYVNKKKNRMTAPTTDKMMKASNFPASFLRIGGWKYESRHEGDLVAKFYFSKRKLVWEVLDNGLKKKIEIQWSDIVALKAICPDKGPGTLTLVLGRQPVFFTETSPQPRRQILWEATWDFTGGQAITYRMHSLQCREGVLNKHYDKLVQFDSRLNLLSQQPDTDLHSPYFIAQRSPFMDQDELRDHGFNRLITAKGSPISTLQDIMSPSPSQSSSSVFSTLGNGDGESYHFHGPISCKQLNEPDIQPSELSDNASYVGHGIPDGTTNENQPRLENAEGIMFNELVEIAEILLGDSHAITTAESDEKALMKRVDSLCCLLQDHPERANEDGQIVFGDAQWIEASDDKSVMMRANSLRCLLQGVDEQKGQFQEHHDVRRHSLLMPENMNADSIMAQAKEQSFQNVSCSSSKAGQMMSRKDSLADLLLSLPNVASLPKFLFDISEDR